MECKKLLKRCQDDLKECNEDLNRVIRRFREALGLLRATKAFLTIASVDHPAVKDTIKDIEDFLASKIKVTSITRIEGLQFGSCEQQLFQCQADLKFCKDAGKIILKQLKKAAVLLAESEIFISIFRAEDPNAEELLDLVRDFLKKIGFE